MNEKQIGKVTKAVAYGMRRLDPGIRWIIETTSGQYPLVLRALHDGHLLRFHLRTLEELTPGQLTEETAAIEASLQRSADAGVREIQSYLFVPMRISDRPVLSEKLAAFNEKNQAARGPLESSAFVALMGVEDRRPEVPAVADSVPNFENFSLTRKQKNKKSRPRRKQPLPAEEQPRPEEALREDRSEKDAASVVQDLVNSLVEGEMDEPAFESATTRALPDISDLPPPPAPPAPRVKEMKEIVAETRILIRRELAKLDDRIVWTPEAERESFFDDVLVGNREMEQYRFFLKVFDTLAPEQMTGLLEYAAGTLRIFDSSNIYERHVYLVVGRTIETLGPIYASLEAFHKQHWGLLNPFASQAFVAYLSGLNGTPVIPGVSDPAPPLNQLQLCIDQEDDLRTRVLLVDDDPLVGAILGDLLEENGYLVEIAEDWEAFRSKITLHRFAVILLDVNLPQVSGDKLALFVQKFLDPPLPQVILHSGIEEPQLRQITDQVGAAGYLCKGCGDEKVLAALVEAVKAYQAAQAEQAEQSELVG
jgi:CheY-like chemotaxis protein